MNIKPNTEFRNRKDYREGFLDGATGKSDKRHHYRFADCYIVGFNEGRERKRNEDKRKQKQNRRAG